MGKYGQAILKRVNLREKGGQDFSQRRPPVSEGQIRVKEGYFEGSVLQKGKVTFKGGQVHEGDFEQERLVQGKMTMSDGLALTGKFDDKRNLQGKGRKDYPLASPLIFERGDFRNNELHGEGRREFRTGVVHEGEFETGKLSLGTISCKEDKTVYQGEFDKDLKLQGEGVKIINGTAYRGIFKDSQLIQGTKTAPDRTITQVNEAAT